MKVTQFRDEFLASEIRGILVFYVLNSDDGLLLTWVTTHYEHYPSYSHYFGNTYLVLF